MSFTALTGGLFCVAMSFLDIPSTVSSIPFSHLNIDLKVSLVRANRVFTFQGNGGSEPDVHNLDERVCLSLQQDDLLQVHVQSPNRLQSRTVASVCIASVASLTRSVTTTIQQLRTAVSESSCCDPNLACFVHFEGLVLEGKSVQDAHDLTDCCQHSCDMEKELQMFVAIFKNLI